VSLATNQNFIREKIRADYIWGMLATWHFAFQNLLSSCHKKNMEIKINETLILSVVLYGCETWSFMLRKEHRLSVFDNRVHRRTFGPKRDEMAGG
jgi:hypothetical protein